MIVLVNIDCLKQERKTSDLHAPEKVTTGLNLVAIVPKLETSIVNFLSFFWASIVIFKYPYLSANKIVCAI